MAELPESIGRLTALTKLNVKFNKLTGEFPRTFPTPLKPVRSISPNERPDFAELPASIGKLTSLTYLGVEANQLTSEFPRTFLSLPKTQYTVSHD